MKHTALVFGILTFGLSSPEAAQPEKVGQQQKQDAAQTMAANITADVFNQPTIDLRVKKLEEEIRIIFKDNSLENAQHILSALIGNLLYEKGGYTGGLISTIRRTYSEHLVLAHYVRELMNRMHLTLDERCMTYRFATGSYYIVPEKVDMTCADYLNQNPIPASDSKQETMGALVAELEALLATKGVKNPKPLDHTPETTAKKEPQVVKSEEDIDTDYHHYMTTLFSYLGNYQVDLVKNPQEYLQSFMKKLGESRLFPPETTLPAGQYAQIVPFPQPWVSNMMETGIVSYNSLGQGWKIHITAMPHSAQKIAELVLPHIKDFDQEFGIDKTEAQEVGYKIITSIPHMRTIWYILKHVSEKESQAGKFIVIYPANTEHAYKLVKMIDEILMNAKKQGILKDQDFQPLTGDAKVGLSGGVYVRYGPFTESHKLAYEVDPKEQKLQDKHGYTDSERDDRSRPWPDFMNKGNKVWSHAPNPFREAPIEWSPPGGKSPVTWDTRPLSWKDFKTQQ